MNISKLLIILNLFIYVFLFHRTSNAAEGEYWTFTITNSAYNMRYDAARPTNIIMNNCTGAYYTMDQIPSGTVPFLGYLSRVYKTKHSANGDIILETNEVITFQAFDNTTVSSTGICTPPPPCEQEEQAAITSCGDVEFVKWENLETCEWSCEQCEEYEQELIAQCQDGYFLDKSTPSCEGNCKVCDDHLAAAQTECESRGGLIEYGCQDNVSENGTQNMTNAHYKCRDEAPETDDGEDNDPQDPGEENDPDPVNDPESTPADNNLSYLPAIKHNTDDLVKNSNRTNQQLENIAENNRRSVDNQGVLNQNIIGLGGQITASGNSLGQKLDGIQEAIEGQDDGPQNYTVTGNATLPTGNTYDGNLDELEESSFFEDITTWISSGIPIVNYLTGTRIQIASSASSMDVEIFDRTITIDLQPMENILHNVGLFLVALSYLVSLLIVIRG